jgi:hypothetical protein
MPCSLADSAGHGSEKRPLASFLTAACLGGYWPVLLATVVGTFGATDFLVKPTDS